MSEPATRFVFSVFASFAVGGPQVRFAALANHLGPAVRHAIVAMDGDYDCAARLSPELDVCFPTIALRRGRFACNLPQMREVLQQLSPDVLVTHNWGSMEWVLANRAGVRRSHVHIEDGFGPDEADAQLRRRVLARRFALGASTVVLPSLTLLKLAAEVWRLPRQRLRFVPNGLDLDRFTPAAPDPRGDPSRGDPSRGDPPRIGAVAALRPEKNLARLLSAAQRLRERGRAFSLTIVGDGPERSRLEAMARELGLTGVVSFAGAAADPAQAYRAFDVFALSSDTEQMPLTVLEAMASGLPVAATSVGDVPQMLSRANGPFVGPRDEASLAEALERLLCDAELRQTVGQANRLKVERDYDQQRMFSAYADLIAPGLPLPATRSAARELAR